ncbi:hypothetical protein [Fortiea sp. LEGE XX443]|uniref:hypothetical protein n=1 Tax=Fortiea sp. LEGE XX443 TaxID=1828611 RepID=UPI00351C0BBF
MPIGSNDLQIAAIALAKKSYELRLAEQEVAQEIRESIMPMPQQKSLTLYQFVIRNS